MFKEATIVMIPIALLLLPILVQAQLVTPPPPLVPPLHLKPGTIQISPEQAAQMGIHGPSAAQIQADIASHQADIQTNHAILDELTKRIGGDTSPAHVAAVIKEMQSIYPGLVHCPGGATNPGSCYVTSRPLGGPISPPVVP